jgi:hypothetical protein
LHLIPITCTLLILVFTPSFLHRSTKSGTDEVISEIAEEMNFHQIVLDKTNVRHHMEGRGRKGQKKNRQKMLTEVEGVMRDLYPDGQFALSQCPRTEIK